MKNKLLFIATISTLIWFSLVACDLSEGILPVQQHDAPAFETGVIKEEIQIVVETPGENELIVETWESSSNYTLEQIQIALEPQFHVGDWGEGSPQVISAREVERDRDSFWFEGAGEEIDISESVRYEVAIRYKQSIEDYNLWLSIIADHPEIDNPYIRDGDYTIMTSFFYFNDENGTPVLAHVAC